MATSSAPALPSKLTISSCCGSFLPLIASQRAKNLCSGIASSTSLDVLEFLVEAAFTRDRKPHLARANLGIDKLRFLIRMAADLRYLDRRRYEYAARSLDEIGRLIGGWSKVHDAATAG